MIDRASSPRHVLVPTVLVGMPGSGKTTVGEILALRLARTFVDLDEAIVARSGHTITELFESVGEPGFRELETVVLADLVHRDPELVVSAGGGVVVSEDNRRLLSGPEAFTVWLRATPTTLAARVGAAGERPLLRADPEGAILRLATDRDALYREVADVVIDVDHIDPGSIVDVLDPVTTC